VGLSQLHIPDCGIIKLTWVYSSFFSSVSFVKIDFFLISSFYVRLLGLELCYFFSLFFMWGYPGSRVSEVDLS
jgi:hypothetical protein